MWWCCYWWLCWFEMMYLLLIMSLRWDDVGVENDIELRWYWCWEWHWDEMLIMKLRWDVVNVENFIVIMCDVYVHGGCSDHVRYPWWGNRVVNEFWAFLEGDCLESLIIHDQCIDGAHVSYFILHRNSINFISKYL